VLFLDLLDEQCEECRSRCLGKPVAQMALLEERFQVFGQLELVLEAAQAHMGFCLLMSALPGGRLNYIGKNGASI
jgi:hypothetical protein